MFDDVLTFCRVAASSLGATAKTVLLNLRGLAAGDNDDTGEQSTEEPVYGALGVVSRPRDPSSAGAAEAVSARRADGLPVIALRDLRLNKARGHVAPGTVSVVGYGGAFLSIDDAPNGGGSVLTLYAPYGFDPEPNVAHSIILDTTSGNEAILIVHGLGHAILLDKDGKVVIKNGAGDVFISVEPDGIVVNGAVKVVGGTMQIATSLVVGNPATAQRAVAWDDFDLWRSQVDAALALIFAANGGTTNPTIAKPLASPIPISVIKGSP
jgi:hypothetical protein